MKKISFVVFCNLVMLCAMLSCSNYHRHNISISISESSQVYKIYARYNPMNTADVDRCINKHLHKFGDMNFENSNIDADLIMDDGTNFYMDKKPGLLKIKFNKEHNTVASFNEVKSLAEDLKRAMQ